MKGILIKNVVDKGERKDLFIDNNIIKCISLAGEKDYSNEGEFETIDANGKYVIPGFINMHTHSAMTLMRGVKEDAPLQSWLESIWEMEPKLDDELIYWGTKLAALEMISTGTTCFNDQYWNIGVAANAVKEMGLRSVQSFVLLDLFDKERAEQMKRDCIIAYEESKRWSPLNTFSLSIHAPYTVSEELIIWGSNFAKEHNLLVHIHISETEQENIDSFNKHNLSPTAYLHKLGVLGPHVLAAHTLWLSEQDIELLAMHKVNVVHNINSNLKLSSGYKFKYNELKEAGVNICLGTDGAASSNNLDMLESMKTTALLQKAWRKDPAALPLSELLAAATANGADALRLNSGRVEEGALADLLLIDVDNYAFTPNYNFLANLIYSANSSCIDTVICNGKVLMQGRKIEGAEEILKQVNRIYKKLL